MYARAIYCSVCTVPDGVLGLQLLGEQALEVQHAHLLVHIHVEQEVRHVVLVALRWQAAT